MFENLDKLYNVVDKRVINHLFHLIHSLQL